MGCLISKDTDEGGNKKNNKVNKNQSQLNVPVSVSFDFHGVKYVDCENFVVYALSHHPKTIGNQKLTQYIFISGKGIHSKDGKAVLKPMIIDKCKEMNYNPVIDPMNEGEILVPLN